jgi:hypothetical protein
MPEEKKTYDVDGFSGYTSGNQFFGEGCSLYTFHLKKYAGINENGESMWYYNAEDAEGNSIMKTTTDYDSADEYLCGTALPDAYGGFSTSLTWKGFDLSVDFSYQIGGQVYDGDYASMMSGNNRGYNIHRDMLNSWTPTNRTDLPRMQYGEQYTNGSSDRFLTDASYLSLNNINFGYTLPRLVTKKAGIESLRVYLAADNICYWSQRKGLDSRQSISGGASNAYYSPIRTISGGVTLTF